MPRETMIVMAVDDCLDRYPIAYAEDRQQFLESVRLHHAESTELLNAGRECPTAAESYELWTIGVHAHCVAELNADELEVK